MFNGENGCFCCPDPPDPPPNCSDCEVCDGVGPDGCVGVVCQTFVLEVENWANSTTTDQNVGVCGGTGTGTQCGAYNGTFPLTRYDDGNTPCSAPPWGALISGGYVPSTYTCCEWRSDTFTATIPTFTEINGIPCVACQEEEVYYRMQFLSYAVPGGSSGSIARKSIAISICQAATDGWLAVARDYRVGSPGGSHAQAIPGLACNVEELIEEGGRQFYFLLWYAFDGNQGGAMFDPLLYQANYFEGLPRTRVPKCGPSGQFLYYDPSLADNNPCLNWTMLSDGSTVSVKYPFWNCCKDSGWNDCTTMQDWADNGITDVCGEDVKLYLPVRLTCAD